jgi:hypothetical protein
MGWNSQSVIPPLIFLKAVGACTGWSRRRPALPPSGGGAPRVILTPRVKRAFS